MGWWSEGKIAKEKAEKKAFEEQLGGEPRARGKNKKYVCKKNKGGHTFKEVIGKHRNGVTYPRKSLWGMNNSVSRIFVCTACKKEHWKFRSAKRDEWEKNFKKLWNFSFENQKGTSPYQNVMSFIRALRVKDREEMAAFMMEMEQTSGEVWTWVEAREELLKYLKNKGHLNL